MALQKNTVAFNFAQGVDTKSDPKQIPIGKFSDLQNSIFDKTGLLKKRNGYSNLTALSSSAYLSTFGGNLIGVSDSLYSYNSGLNSWTNQGSFQTANNESMSLIKSPLSKGQVDSVVASNGLICVVYTEIDPSANWGATPPAFYYSILDSNTGAFVVQPTTITATAGTTNGSPKVFLLGNYFIILFSTDAGSSNYDIQYIAIPTATPTSPVAAVTVATNYKPNTNILSGATLTYRPSYDGVVANDILYMAWNTTYGTGPINVKTLNSSLTLSSATSFSINGDFISMCADTSGGPTYICISGVKESTNTITSITIDTSIAQVGSAGTISPVIGETIKNVTSSATGGTLTIFCDWLVDISIYKLQDRRITYSTRATNIGSPSTLTKNSLCRSLGLASRSFIVNGSVYVIGVYSANRDTIATSSSGGDGITNYTSQPTYFLLNSSGKVVSKIAESNSGGYTVNNMYSVSVNSNVATFAYLYQDLVLTEDATNGAFQIQLGINLEKITIGTQDIQSVEAANSLILSGGLVRMYDGRRPVELGFNLYPDLDILNNSTKADCITVHNTGSDVTIQDYYFIAVYEWTDSSGNIHRSAPSVAAFVSSAVITAAAPGSRGLTITVPTLRVTDKSITNNVRINLYQWSTAQQTFNSLGYTLANDPTVDYVRFNPGSTLAGSQLLYTTGGVVENIAPPASSSMTIYKSRLFSVDAEDRNVIWYSKQIIEATPIEMSDLFTIYVGPNANANVSSGPITALAVMDDKLIIFKENDIFYITGTGPDNTGANNDFSEPIYISSIAGCSNKQSIVQTPEGLMFQSKKGIWLLNRSMQVTYIGAPVEAYNSYDVVSAVNILGTNQVRFAMSNDITLVYDYFFGQWGTFTGIPMVSSTIYDDVHTFINSSGAVFKETAGQYYDGTTASPVLMSFTTGPMNISGVQGFERAYFFTFIGDYLSPHTLTCNIAYDYDGYTQSSVINPDSADALEQWQVYFRQQKLQTVQVQIQESYTAGGTPGAGFNMSGINFQIGVKAQTPKLKQTVSVG